MDNNRMFVNPYNFVPLGDGSKRPRSSSDEEILTGEIVCTLEIKTPLAIPDTEDQPTDENTPKRYDFMSVDDKYIIPGSEIRGMIRNVYETITDSCLSVVNSNIITKRDGNPVKNPGLLFWDSESKKWIIWEAIRYNSKNRDDLESMKKKLRKDDVVFVERKWNPLSSREIKTSIFYDAGGDWYYVDEEIIENLINALNSYIANNEGRAWQYEAVMPKKDGSAYPVYYAVSGNSDDSVVLVAPAQISRRTYNKVTTMLGKYAPCEDVKSLCPSCLLFGTITKSGVKASKLRFCDAVLSKDSVFELSKDFVPLKILSSPHLNSTEFYSIKNGLSSFRNVRRWEYNHNGVSLRGRKFYLHNPKAATDASVYSEDDIIISESGKPLNSAYMLANSGKFTFKIFFDRISRSELRDLVWSLTLGNGDENGNCYCHKLGHGKPLGLGSVLITVDAINKRTTSEGYKVESIPQNTLMDGYKPPISGSTTLAALQTICDYNYANGENITYPIGCNRRGKENTMFWFSSNHGAIGGRQPFKYVLHPVVDDNGNRYVASKLRLPYMRPEN